MMGDWYLRQKGQTSGPFSWEDLRFLAERQKIAESDFVRQGANGDWLAADSVRGLLATAHVNVARSPSAVPARPANAPQPPPPGASRPGASRPRDVAPPLPAVPMRPAPPPLPSKRADDARRRIILAIVAATGLLAGLFCLLLLALLLRLGTGAIASGSGGGNGGGGAGESAGGEGSSDSEGFGEEEMPGETPLEAPEAPDPTAKGDEGPTSDDPPTDAPSKQSPETGGGEGSSPDAVPEPPPPPSAAVVMPLDDEPSPDDPNAVDPSSTGGSAEFFEIKGTGRRFVYVVDCSGSMLGEPFAKARTELQRSIEALNSGQSFFVIFFDNAEYPQFHPQTAEGLLRASAENKRRLRDWANGFQPPGGGTDPSAALMRALSLGPDAIYLLSDGAFDVNVARAVRARNRNNAVIHTVSFMTRDAEVLLQNIARQNRGTYRFVP